ncbi:UNKNOWN [Stylonychia lemnae]|uniref:Transmembrane protein n=1 Tax=Stylonychia lemnae TaxID=5949 RepID=A0A078AP78_STYLE|nr:UNKNOWN [Stylonychia lemnae]|eukprot:CDW83929.1 UNKNOWN [Stylonychia lemnae]
MLELASQIVSITKKINFAPLLILQVGIAAYKMNLVQQIIYAQIQPQMQAAKDILLAQQIHDAEMLFKLNDQIILRFSRLTGANVFLYSGGFGFDTSQTQTRLVLGKNYSIPADQRMYVVIVPQTGVNADFTLISSLNISQIQYNNSVSDASTSNNITAISKITSSNEITISILVIIIVGSVIGCFIFAAIIVISVYRYKRKNLILSNKLSSEEVQNQNYFQRKKTKLEFEVYHQTNPNLNNGNILDDIQNSTPRRLNSEIERTIKEEQKAGTKNIRQENVLQNMKKKQKQKTYNKLSSRGSQDSDSLQSESSLALKRGQSDINNLKSKKQVRLNQVQPYQQQSANEFHNDLLQNNGASEGKRLDKVKNDSNKGSQKKTNKNMMLPPLRPRQNQIIPSLQADYQPDFGVQDDELNQVGRGNKSKKKVKISQVTAYTFITSSLTCRTSCLDQSKIFCPTIDKKGGYCCDLGEKCPNPFGFCSNNMQGIPAMQQFLCPFETFCGPTTYIIDSTTTQQTLSVNNRLFVNKAGCQYIFQPPSNALTGDYIQVRLEQLVNAQVLINQSQNLTSFGTQYLLSIGNWVSIYLPNKIYMTASGTSTVAGQFALSYQFVKKGTLNNGTNATSLQFSSSSGQSNDNTLLFIFIAVGLIAILIIVVIVLIYVFRRVKNKKVTPNLVIEELKQLQEKDTENKDNLDQDQGPDLEEAQMLDEYYNRTINITNTNKNETPKQLKKQFFQSDIEDNVNNNINDTLSKNKPPKNKLSYKSDKESTTVGPGSRIIATDTEGMPSVTGSNKKQNSKVLMLPPIIQKKRIERINEELDQSIEEPKPSNKFFNLPKQAMAKTSYDSSKKQSIMTIDLSKIKTQELEQLYEKKLQGQLDLRNQEVEQRNKQKTRKPSKDSRESREKNHPINNDQQEFEPESDYDYAKETQKFRQTFQGQSFKDMKPTQINERSQSRSSKRSTLQMPRQYELDDLQLFNKNSQQLISQNTQENFFKPLGQTRLPAATMSKTQQGFNQVLKQKRINDAQRNFIGYMGDVVDHGEVEEISQFTSKSKKKKKKKKKAVKKQNLVTEELDDDD